MVGMSRCSFGHKFAEQAGRDKLFSISFVFLPGEDTRRNAGGEAGVIRFISIPATRH